MGRWDHGTRRWSVLLLERVLCYTEEWADELGSGLGALAALLETRQDEMFPNITFPDDYNTAVLKAAYIFSYLTYVIYYLSKYDLSN